MMALNLILGLTLGVGLALITEYLDKRFKTVDEVERYLGLPCLGVIPHQRRIRRLGKPITLRAPGSRIAEAYRTIRTWLQAPTSQTVKTLLITSATPTEGKSTTAANLAVSFAQLGWRVLLVDVDLRRPAMHRAFGLQNDQEGLTDVLVHGTDWHQILRDTDLENLKVLPAGFIPSNPVDLLSTRRMKTFTAQVKRAFDLVIFDAPMVLSLPDVTILAPTMDGVLLVHYPMRRNRNVVMQAKRLLERRGAPLLGIVLNNVNEKLMSYYTSYRYEGYSTPAVRPVRLAGDGAVAPAIHMRPGAEGENWLPEPLAPHAGAAALPSIAQKTASNGDVMITIHTVFLRQRLGEEESDPGNQFLVLDVEIANATESAYTFRPGQTTVSVNPQSEYSRVLASLIEMPDRSGGAVAPLPPGRQIYMYDPVSTCQLEEGLAEEESIAAKGVRRGLLVYRVPLAIHSYVFEYESDDSTFTILLGKS
jgi:capsular exopolysaccharide synthesis family protein